MKRNKLYGMVLAASLSTGLTLAPVFTPPSAAQVRTNQTAVGTLLAGLINVNAQNIDVTAFDLVDVNNVLNNNQVDILRNAIINIPIASFNQSLLSPVVSVVLGEAVIVVGVLNGVIYYLPL